MKKIAIGILFAVGIAWSPQVQALSLAESYNCCEMWLMSGSRPDSCEPTQTREYCEEKLNNPQPDYTVECWDRVDAEACRTEVDAKIAQRKAEVAQNPIRLNPTFSEKASTFMKERALTIVVGVLIIALGAIALSRRK